MKHVLKICFLLWPAVYTLVDTVHASHELLTHHISLVVSYIRYMSLFYLPNLYFGGKILLI
jgi:hypothetical protein